MDQTIIGWYQGLADFGCTFVEMVFTRELGSDKVKKKPRRTLDHYAHMVREMGVAFALACIERGSPVGIMPKGRLWVLDVDNAEQVERVVSLLMDRGITPLMVSTRRGAHFYFRLPDNFHQDGLKNAIHAPALDFIFGPRALLVAPGSNSKGRDYKPASTWFPPPVVDPRDILPDGAFWEPHDLRPFLVSTESQARRTFAARGYLKHQASVCVRGIGKGSRTLGKVAAHVVSWWGMSPAKATAMMTSFGSWNSRFVDGDGKPAPFQRDEILAACEAAEGKGSEYGRRRWIDEQISQAETQKMESHIQILKNCLTEPKSLRVPVTDVLGVFSWLGCPDLTATKFGIALSNHGIKRVQATRRKLWSIERLDIRAMTRALIDAEKTRQGAKATCPLIALLGESLKEHQPVPLLDEPTKTAQVEQVVSDESNPEARTVTKKDAA